MRRCLTGFATCDTLLLKKRGKGRSKGGVRVVYTIDEIRDITSPIAASYGVRRLSLFGSYARGEATDSSDVDLLLDREGMARGWAIGGLYSDLRDALGKELDMVTTASAEAAFLARIRRDEVTLYER